MTEDAPGPLSLHVPEPEWRPGDVPEFSGVAIPRAGTVRRPAVDEDPENMRDLAFTIIRVLNRNGEAVATFTDLNEIVRLPDGMGERWRFKVEGNAESTRLLFAGTPSEIAQHLAGG